MIFIKLLQLQKRASIHRRASRMRAVCKTVRQHYFAGEHIGSPKAGLRPALGAGRMPQA